jgi:hypothetical protein
MSVDGLAVARAVNSARIRRWSPPFLRYDKPSVKSMDKVQGMSLQESALLTLPAIRSGPGIARVWNRCLNRPAAS